MFHGFCICVGATVVAACCAQAVVATDSYSVNCIHYYQDTAAMVNGSVGFVRPVGTYNQYTNGTTVTLTCDPTAISTLPCSAGYYVTGWDFDEEWGTRQPGTFNPTHYKQYGAVNPLTVTFNYAGVGTAAPKTIDLVPHISMMHYTLAYDKNASDATGTAPESADHSWSESVTVSGRGFSRNGYTPTGWNSKPDASGADVDFEATVSGETFPVTNHNQSVTLYAQWSVNQYPLQLRVAKGIAKLNYEVTIKGVKTSGSVTSDADLDVDYGTEYKVWAEARAGYNTPAPAESNPAKGTMNTEVAIVASSATPNTIEVTFDGNGETSGSMDRQTFTVDVANYLAKNAFKRGYKVSFDSNGGTSCEARTSSYEQQDPCWNDKPDGSGKYWYADGQSVTNPCDSVGEAVKLYTQWNTNNVTAITLPTTERNGHTHSGWYADCGLTEYIGVAGAAYMPTNDITLYAGWEEKTYSVKFYDDDPSEGGNLISEQSVSWHGSAVEPDHPTKEYYKFSNWNTTGWKSVESDLQVWPEWSGKAYKIVYNSNYSNGKKEKSIAGDSCGPEVEVKKIEIDDASTYNYEKVGYAFDGWETNKYAKVKKWDVGVKLHYSSLDEIGGGKESVDFYAIWSPNAYKVRFDGGPEAAGTMQDQSFEYGEAKSLTANAFKRADEQVFRHWTNSLGAVFADCQVVSNLTTTADATIDLYAVWSNYHYVRFDGNGATNESEMAVQKFSGAETNALSANAYGKVGYTFAGWATNAVAATNLRVTYTNCQEAAFPAAKANETNVLYAVWTTNRYAIAFDPSWPAAGAAVSNRYCFGEMAVLADCAYDTAVTVRCGYTNFCSQGLLGWSRTPGAATAEYAAEHLWEGPEPGDRKVCIGADTVVSNLTATAGCTQTLYAVWSDAGEISSAVGISNAVLFSSAESVHYAWRVTGGSDYDWDVGHPLRAACSTKYEVSEAATCRLTMKAVGNGTLDFRWCCRHAKQLNGFSVSVDGTVVTNLYNGSTMTQKRNWDFPVKLAIAGDGLHELSWLVDAQELTPSDVIAIDDVVWTPGAEAVELKPGGEPPKYANESEAKAAAANAKVVRPNAAVEGVVTAEDYNALFDVCVRPSGDVAKPWQLAPELKPAVSNEVRIALGAASDKLVGAMARQAIASGALDTEVTTKAGLYYGIAATNRVAWLKTAAPTNWTLGDGDTQSLSVGVPSVESGFFELRATEIPPR